MMLVDDNDAADDDHNDDNDDIDEDGDDVDHDVGEDDDPCPLPALPYGSVWPCAGLWRHDLTSYGARLRALEPSRSANAHRLGVALETKQGLWRQPLTST